MTNSTQPDCGCFSGEVPVMQEIIPDLRSQHVRTALQKLTVFSLLIIGLPLVSMFAFKKFIFESECDTTNPSTTIDSLTLTDFFLFRHFRLQHLRQSSILRHCCCGSCSRHSRLVCIHRLHGGQAGHQTRLRELCLYISTYLLITTD